MHTSLLVLHILGGIVGVASGFVAMAFRKGSSRHRLVGDVFVVSMIVMGGCAVPLALMKNDMPNLVAGLVTIYVVSTAWWTARRSDDGRRTSWFDWGGFLFALAMGSLTMFHGWQKVTGRAGDDGAPNFMTFFMGSIILLAAAGDLRMIFRGVSGRARISRHLWRMCFGWFVASGSFFLGPNNRPLRLLSTVGLRQPIFRSLLREEVLIVLSVMPLLLLIFWMIRVRFAGRYRKGALAAPAAAQSLAVR